MKNKNKEEIEKLMHECTKPFNPYAYSQIKLQERIKTSILWCEDEIEFCNEILSQNPNAVNEEDTKYKLKELQTHLKWLKEQEQIE